MNSWWTTDSYRTERVIPNQFDTFEGPEGTAMVAVFKDGTTQPGWGESKFMANYNRKRFTEARFRQRYDAKDPFAYVMRSLSLVVIDIDGKNDGYEGVKSLYLENFPTLAETSKSGNGHHLYYSLGYGWDPVTGFGTFPDKTGFEPGVDIKNTGCVFHYTQQRWNDREIAPLPDHVHKRLSAAQARKAFTAQRLATLAAADPDDTEALMEKQELIDELKKPIKAGSRNTSLFAIGGKMKQAGIEFEDLVFERGIELGLDDNEMNKIVRNIQLYG